MIAKLEFQLPEETGYFKDACEASRYRCALEDVAARIRSRLKHEQPSKAERSTLEDLRAIVCECLAYES